MQHTYTVKSALCKNMFRKGMFSDLTHDVLASENVYEVKAVRMCLEKRLLAKYSFYSL